MPFGIGKGNEGRGFMFHLGKFLRLISQNRNEFVGKNAPVEEKDMDPKKELELIKRGIESLRKAIENLTKQIKDIKQRISILVKNPEEVKGTELEELKKQLKELEEQRKSYKREKEVLEEKQRKVLKCVANKIAGKTGTGVRGVPTKTVEERFAEMKNWIKSKGRVEETVTTDISNGNMNFKSVEGRSVFVMDDNDLRAVDNIDGSLYTGHMTESEVVADKESWRNKIAEAKDLAYKHNSFIKSFGRDGKEHGGKDDYPGRN